MFNVHESEDLLLDAVDTSDDDLDELGGEEDTEDLNDKDAWDLEDDKE